MMTLNRRAFVAGAAGLAASTRLPAQESARVADATLTVISGSPRERGRQYGRAFKDAIRAFLDREIYQSFTKAAPMREEVLHYAGACAKVIRAYSPEITDELEGMAEGSGVSVEELVLVNNHEELWHRGVLPPIEKCTAIAAGPPATGDGHAYVAQTWDWMQTVYGLSNMLLWKRERGPSVLAYAYPGLWAGAGLNSAGIALCWTSGEGLGIAGPRVGIPAYVLIAQILYQPTLDAVVEEAKRATHAGWFTFVLADAEGRLLNLEGTPKELAVEFGRGTLARVAYGSRQLLANGATLHARARGTAELMGRAAGKIDRAWMQRTCGDHGDEGAGRPGLCQHPGTIDAMVYDCTKREAYVTRGPGCTARWKKFTFEG
jgi:isopenicillin-N N-acyltransferase-like protein